MEGEGYNIHPKHSVIAFTDLYEQREFDGELATSFTIITVRSPKTLEPTKFAERM